MTRPSDQEFTGLLGLSQPSQSASASPPGAELHTNSQLTNGPLLHDYSTDTTSQLSASDSHHLKTSASLIPESQHRSQSQGRFSDSSSAHSPTRHIDAAAKSIRQFILRSFAPRVAVFASPDTEEFVRNKGFKDGLCSLLRPFGENVPGKVIIRDSVGGSKAWDGFGIRFIPSQLLQKSSGAAVSGASGLWDSQARVNGALYPPSHRSGPDPSAAVEASLNRFLRSVSGSFSQHDEQTYSAGGKSRGTEDQTSPIYLHFMRRLLSSSPIAPHETFSHPVSCLIAVSSHNPAPIDALRKLYASTGHGNHNVPEWMGTEYLRYYVLIHDEENDDITKSTALFDLMKRHFGLHCHLLRLRSSQCVQSDDDSLEVPAVEWLPADEEAALERMKGESIRSPFGSVYMAEIIDFTNDIEATEQYLSESDTAAINTFHREMVAQSIVPFMENRVTTWNDQVASRRRGLSGKFMSLSKRWTGFGSAKGGTSSPGGPNSSGSNYNSQEGFYPPESPEATMRQLADYAFMLRDWKLAYTTYDLVRADFGHDKAWQYHAAASEMAAISSLLNSQTSMARYRADIVDQMLDSASYSYLTRCAMPWGVIRCLTLALELLMSKGSLCTEDAARWGGKLLEFDVLRPVSQVLITERIADCYISRSTLRQRQAAFWNILASSK